MPADGKAGTAGSIKLPETRLFIDGQWVEGASRREVRDKFHGSAIAEVSQADRAQVAQAAAGAQAAHKRGAPPPAERAAILYRAAEILKKRGDGIVEVIIAEAGFTRAEAAGEVARGTQTLIASAEEAKRQAGEMIPLAGAPGQQNRLGFTLRVPIGVVCAITPFNAPFNTVLHKVAPAFAAGNPLILKPASATPLTGAAVIELLLEAGAPKDFLSLLHGAGNSIGRWLSEEPAIRYFAFTGSTEVGKRIHAAAGLRKTQMELGSIAATILNADADLDVALPKVMGAGYRKAGQVCTSIQRLYVHESVFGEVKEYLTRAVSALRAGNPHEEGTDVGPMIDEKEAVRIESWVAEAVEAGATVLAGGTRHGPVFTPTLIDNVTPQMRVMAEEVFAPVMMLRPFGHLDEAIDEINATPYGLATGIFTRDIEAGMHAARTLQVGGVHINETSSSRVDVMPYGGCKDSGFGREGPRYAMHEMTEERLVTVTLGGLKGR